VKFSFKPFFNLSVEFQVILSSHVLVNALLIASNRHVLTAIISVNKIVMDILQFAHSTSAYNTQIKSTENSPS